MQHKGVNTIPGYNSFSKT